MARRKKLAPEVRALRVLAAKLGYEITLRRKRAPSTLPGDTTNAGKLARLGARHARADQIEQDDLADLIAAPLRKA